MEDPELAAMAQTKAKRERKAEPSEGDVVIGDIVFKGSSKVKVNNICTRLHQQHLKKGDILYETAEATEGGWQSLVTMKVLPGDLAETPIAGETCDTEKEAEESAAKFAIEAIMVDEEVVKAIEESKPFPPEEDRAERQRNSKRMRGSGMVEANMGPDGETKKQSLNNYILKVLPRSKKKGDIVYTTAQVQGGYQSTVKCPCLPTPLAEAEFAGEVCEIERDSEHSAAGIALTALMDDPEIQELHDKWQSKEARLGKEPELGPDGEPLPKRQKKGKAEGEKKGDAGDHSSDYTPKQLLNNCIIKIVPRSIRRGEIEYKTQQVEGGWQATLTMHCLPNALRESSFAGIVCETEKEAIHSAASIGMEAVMADDELKEMHDAGCRLTRKAQGIMTEAEQRRAEGKTSRRDKGKGKGKCPVPQEVVQITEPFASTSSSDLGNRLDGLLNGSSSKAKGKGQKCKIPEIHKAGSFETVGFELGNRLDSLQSESSLQRPSERPTGECRSQQNGSAQVMKTKAKAKAKGSPNLTPKSLTSIQPSQIQGQQEPKATLKPKSKAKVTCPEPSPDMSTPTTMSQAAEASTSWSPSDSVWKLLK
eukprot:gnl/MRDRNA2_/MRDRNA2_60335_c0_seq1.p1 gnl/MRDRNA2_/MRDRNA2_60335_c0~~gnl/MRDRNA2_/MRDRNA2_60335_c0_seq1.p1  ORF type:complete len:695 (-),score=179.73 gnl/MRDRNA2_/MRDRNA2_60335_c0_seq1:330-2105(-)